MKSIAHILFLQVNSWQNDMTGRFVPELYNAFSQVRIHYFHALLFEVMIQMTFLREHTFALHDPRDAFILYALMDDPVMFRRISGLLDPRIGRGLFSRADFLQLIDEGQVDLIFANQTEIKALYAQFDVGPVSPEVRELTARTIARVRGTEEAREGFAAFLAKRPAAWLPGASE